MEPDKPAWGALHGRCINRITQTPTYDYTGRALTTVDGMGRQFDTVYDLDGRVQTVIRTDSGLNQPIVTYTYRTTGLTNGVVMSVVDGLSGVQQNFGYVAAGNAGAGQVSGVTEINGTDSYSVTYQYDPQSDVSVKKYHIPTTPGASTYNDTEWQFADYISFGASGNRVPRTLVQLASTDGGKTWNPTSEEFDYAYDMAGRLIEATFAMTPQTGQLGYSPSYPAGSRGRAFYQYDSGGRLLNLQHYWDVWNGSNGYNSTAILGNSCVYDPVKNQKVESDFWSADPTTGQWKTTPDRTETYQYDPNQDYLTQANYGDGLPNAVQNWTYDAAGNRASDDSNPGTWSYDALNRMTASPGLTYGNDLAGNRTSRSDGVTYGWDALNRMTSYASGEVTTCYAYRADGLRVSKSAPSGTVACRYDGPNSIEEDVLTTSGMAVTAYCDGPRGVELLAGQNGTLYPLYDAHGDVEAVASRGLAGSFSLSYQRSYGCWGDIRQGAVLGGPEIRHCGSLGHHQDDESGLIYMRARSYEVASGRFLSEDPDKNGRVWFGYCENAPTCGVDKNGRDFNPSYSPQEFLYVQGLLQMWSMAIRLSPVFRGVAWDYLVLFTQLNDGVQLMPVSVNDKINRDVFLADLTTVTFDSQTSPLAGSPTSQIIGTIGGYMDGLEIAGWMLGLWGPDSMTYLN